METISGTIQGETKCRSLIGVKKMTDKTCKTCIENDNGLCDRKGILIENDDTCEKWKSNNSPDWRTRMLNTFLAGH